MNVSYDFKKAKELNNDVSGQSSDDDDTELSTPETRPTLSNNSSNQKFDFCSKPSKQTLTAHSAHSAHSALSLK